jgi:energy-coupling factor transporter ATP-binding protein EcfA2
MISELDAERVSDKVAKIRFPTPSVCGRTPLVGKGLTKTYGSLEIFTGVDLAIDKGSRVVVLGLNGAGKTTLLRILAGVEKQDAGVIEPGGTTERGEEGVQGRRVPVHAVPRHFHKRLEGGAGGVGRQGREDGGEGGKREQALGAHGGDGVPHGIEEAILAEEVDDEVPRVGGVLVAQVAMARPAEEGGGAARVRVREAEHLLDVGGGDPHVGVVERRLHIGGGGGQDLAEETDLGG